MLGGNCEKSLTLLLDKSRVSRLTRPANTLISDISLLERSSLYKSFICSKLDILDIWLLLRVSILMLGGNCEKSLTLLLDKSRVSRLTRPANTLISDISLLERSRLYKSFICSKLDILDIWLLLRVSILMLGGNCEKSLTLLLDKSRVSRLTRPANTLISDISLLERSRLYKSFICSKLDILDIWLLLRVIILMLGGNCEKSLTLLLDKSSSIREPNSAKTGRSEISLLDRSSEVKPKSFSIPVRSDILLLDKSK